MTVGVRTITKSTMRQWSTNLIQKRHTPVLVMGIGHGVAQGELSVISVSQMSNSDIVLMLRAAIESVQERTTDDHDHK